MAAKSGQKKVAAAGTAVALGDQLINGGLLVKALDSNTGLVYVGNDGTGDVTVDNGIQLDKNTEIYFSFVGNLSSIMLDAAVNDEGVAWLALEV